MTEICMLLKPIPHARPRCVAFCGTANSFIRCSESPGSSASNSFGSLFVAHLCAICNRSALRVSIALGLRSKSVAKHNFRGDHFVAQMRG
jgi:hypothetical protein